MSRVIIVEERLRTRWMTVVLAVVSLLVVVVEVVTWGVSHSAIPLVILTVVVAGLIGATVAFAHVVVRVSDGADGRSLDVLYGKRGFVRQHFAATDIVSAQANSVSLVQLGGWGYRGSLRLFRYAALSTRGGDCLQLRLTKNRTFVVTVDEPSAFVAALSTRPSTPNP